MAAVEEEFLMFSSITILFAIVFGNGFRMVPTPFPLGNIFRFMCLFPKGTSSVAGEGFVSLFPSVNFLTHHENSPQKRVYDLNFKRQI